MQTRTVGHSTLAFSVIGLGSWAMGGGDWQFGWGRQEDEESIRTIHRAVDQGINWIDTAAVYGLGHSEEVVGEALARMSGPRPFIATKFSRVWNTERSEIVSQLGAENIRREVEASLRRLRVETIDLYQMHWPRPEEQIEEAWYTVAELIRAGKVRYGGVCNFSVDQLRRLQPIYPITTVQPPYSMLKRDIETDLLLYCAENGIGVVVYSPIQKGILSDRYTREKIANLDPQDHRRNDPMFQEPALSLNLRLVEGLRQIAGQKGCTVAQLSIAWVLRQPAVTAAIVGLRNEQQVDENVQAGEIVLTEAEVQAIEGLLAERGA